MTPTNDRATRSKVARSPYRRLQHATLALATLSIFSGIATADSVESFAARLSSLRGEVEALSDELSTLTTESRDQLRAKSRQKADLELDLESEEMRQRKLRHALTEKKKTITGNSDRDAALSPLLYDSLKLVEAHVRGGLPFRKEQRLLALKKLKTQVETKLLSAPRGVSRLWSFVEDELRLSRESGLYRQSIELDGVQQLAEVVRIGTVMLLFKASDKSVGFAVRHNGGFEFRRVEGPKQAKQIVDVFTSFKKQIRAGYFQLPNALINSEVVSEKGTP